MGAPPKVPLPPLAKLNINEEIFDVNLSARLYFHKYYRKEIKWGVVASVIFEVVTVYFLFSAWMSNSLDDPRAVFVIFLPLFIYFGAVASFAKKFRHLFYKQFAAANGFSYTQSGWIPGFLGAVFLVGHTKRMEDIIEGNVDGVPFKLLNYKYTVGQGKEARVFEKTICQLDFKTMLPSMMLLSDAHAFGDEIWDNSMNLPNRISLNENLEKHFTLFAETKFEIEALQIFSPEFLSFIYENFRQFSLDFFGTSLFVYSNKVITTKAELLKLQNFADEIIDRLSHKLPALSGSVLAMQEAYKKPDRGIVETVSKTITKVSSNSPIIVLILPIFIFVVFLLLMLFS